MLQTLTRWAKRLFSKPHVQDEWNDNPYTTEQYKKKMDGIRFDIGFHLMTKTSFKDIANSDTVYSLLAFNTLNVIRTWLDFELTTNWRNMSISVWGGGGGGSVGSWPPAGNIPGIPAGAVGVVVAGGNGKSVVRVTGGGGAGGCGSVTITLPGSTSLPIGTMVTNAGGMVSTPLPPLKSIGPKSVQCYQVLGHQIPVEDISSIEVRNIKDYISQKLAELKELEIKVKTL